MNTEQVAEILKGISYKTGYGVSVVTPTQIRTYPSNSRGSYVQVEGIVRDVDTGFKDWQRGKREYIDLNNITEGELVQLVFSLYQQFEDHECREAFEYKGFRVYGPHMTLDSLITAARLSRFDGVVGE
jgi:hypothetical protein